MSDSNRGYDAALALLRKGWHVIPLHGVDSAGRCTCGKEECGPGNRTAGKHPVRGRWQVSERMSEADVFTTWVEDGPLWNVGIVTGEPSKFFALDIDPKDGGFEELGKLTGMHGALPRTYTVRTGSGGLHYYFTLPSELVGNSVKRVARGVDIRGRGGQVVGAGSVSSLGAYTVVDDGPIVEAPGWLLDLVRKPGGLVEAEAPAVEDLPIYGDLDPEVAERAQRYAEAAVKGEVAAYVHAEAGAGNAGLFASACRVLEIVQSTWNLLTVKDAHHALNLGRQERLRLNASRGGGQDYEEFAKTFASAQTAVVGKGRELPPDRTSGLMFDDPTLVAQIAEKKDDSLASVSGEASELVGGAGGGDAAGLMFNVPEVAKVDPVEWILGRMLTAEKVRELPRPKHLVQGLLDMDSESWLIAEPGGFKSFVALDIACHVAGGRSWRGRLTRAGKVVYMAAEGAKGVSQRLEAWERTYTALGDDLLVYPEPIQVMNEMKWAAFIAACERVQPALIVLDTQARITVGINENAAGDFGVALDAISRLRARTGACVLVIHHVGRNGEGARGTTAIDGVQDTELRVKRPEGKAKRDLLTASICIDKQKDGSESGEIPIQMIVVELGINPETNEPYTSLAIKPYDPFMAAPVTEASWRKDLTDNARSILAVLEEHGETDNVGNEIGKTLREIEELVKARHVEGKGVPITRPGIAYALQNTLCVKRQDGTQAVYRGGTEARGRYYLTDPEGGI